MEITLFTLLTVLTIVFSLQALSYVFLMIYAWEDLSAEPQDKLPPAKPFHSFSALIPARFEENVIEDTIKAIDGIDYPQNLKEIIVLCRYDDEKTIIKVKNTIDQLNNPSVCLVEFYDGPINKPHALNIGLKQAVNDFIVVFDAEDQPHSQLYRQINDVILKQKAEVVQAGVQLMNVSSRWFSVFNVLEYFFWFKSILHFFARQGIIPLGGNSVFIRKTLLEKIQGWDESCLTEDADIGLRLSKIKAKVSVFYQEKFVTQEETPLTISGFIKQRTRWNLGFLQILAKEDWRSFPSLSQSILALYILLLPSFLVFTLLYIPFSLMSVLTFKVPVGFALGTFLPLLILGLQMTLYLIGFLEFKRAYQIKTSLLFPLRILLLYFPYQSLLFVSTIRASWRLVKGNLTWEKTHHMNAHRRLNPQADLVHL